MSDEEYESPQVSEGDDEDNEAEYDDDENEENYPHPPYPPWSKPAQACYAIIRAGFGIDESKKPHEIQDWLSRNLSILCSLYLEVVPDPGSALSGTEYATRDKWPWRELLQAIHDLYWDNEDLKYAVYCLYSTEDDDGSAEERKFSFLERHRKIPSNRLAPSMKRIQAKADPETSQELAWKPPPRSSLRNVCFPGSDGRVTQ